MEEQKALIGRASIYNKIYYYNPLYSGLPPAVLAEVQEICTHYAAKLHCIFALKYRENGDVYFECLPEEWDESFDEIGAKLDMDKLARERRDFFLSLKAWYRFKDSNISLRIDESSEAEESQC